MKIILSESQIKNLISEISAEVVKGIGAIVDGNEEEFNEKNAIDIPIGKLFKNQPDDQGDKEKGYNKMVNDITKKTKDNKKFTPLIVTKEGKKYRIIDGHHRYDAFKKLGKEKIKCIVIPEKDVEFKYLTKKMEKKLTN